MNNSEKTADCGINTPETVDTPTATEQERTFTQDDLNHIVGERLAKEKAKYEAAIAEREQNLAQRELLFQAQQKLDSLGYSHDLLQALNMSDAETFEKSISIVEKVFGNLKNRPQIVLGAKPGVGTKPPGKDVIRSIMGLDRKGDK